MYLSLLLLLGCLSSCHCFVQKDDDKDHCDMLQHWLQSCRVSVELSNNGFHREVTTILEPRPDLLRPDLLSTARVLLVYRWPSGVYIDPYQVASLNDQTDWQILLDSDIDLEVPAHKTSGFLSYVYPSNVGQSPLKITIPVHGRYHEPSFDGRTFTSVDIQPPDLLLRSEKCTHLNTLEHVTVVNAPCAVHNSRVCSWVKIHQQQELGVISFQLPIGDRSHMLPVCVGTLLVTIICCVVLTKYMLKHQIVQA